jgi:hypothetical protein
VLLRQRVRGAAEHHLVNLGLQVPMMVLPVLAAVVTSATETAYFATARLAATFLFMFPFALALALFATTRRSPGDVALTMRRTLPGGLALSAALVLVTEATAEPILSIFGREYSAQAAGQLRILALAGIALVIKDHYIALRRIEGRVARATPVVLAGVALEVTLALAGGWLGGIRGLCFGWVVATACEALIVTPALTVTFRSYRRTGRHRRRRRTHHSEHKNDKEREEECEKECETDRARPAERVAGQGGKVSERHGRRPRRVGRHSTCDTEWVSRRRGLSGGFRPLR